MKLLIFCACMGPLMLAFKLPTLLAQLGSLSQNFCVRHLPPETAYRSIYAGLVCGKAIAQKTELVRLLECSQLIHLIVVSGSHLVLLQEAIEFVSQRWLRPELARVLSFSFLITYAFLTGFQPPCVRALLFFLARLIGERHHAFFVSLLLSLMLNPAWIFSFSFQLSVTASLLLLIGGYLLTSRTAKSFWTQSLLTVGMAPLLGFFSGVGLLLNFLVAPILSLFLFPLALIGLVVHPLTVVFDACLSLLEKFLGALPLSQALLRLPSWPIFIVYLALLYSLFHLSQARARQKQIWHAG